MEIVIPSSARLAYIPEVLDEIVKYLPRGTLKQTARVSFFFHFASIKRLWSGIDFSDNGDVFVRGLSLMTQLGTLFPQGLLLREDGHTTPKFTRPTTPNDWARFKHYSINVQALVIRTHTYWPDLYAVLNSHSLDLFPRLQLVHITWRCVRERPQSEWIELIGSPLRTFEVNLNQEATGDLMECLQELDSVLRRVIVRSPQLKKVVCDDTAAGGTLRHMPDQLATSFGLAIKHLTHLESFTWNLSYIHLPANLLCTLSALPHLTQLCLRNALPPQGCQRDLETHFPALKKLRLDGAAAETDAWLGHVDKFPSLSHLLVKSFPIRPPSFQIPNLTTLHLRLDQHAEWDSLRHLLSCRFMTQCYIHTSWGVAGLDDGTLGRIASSWRELEEFSLIMPNKYVAITFLGLASFALWCPKLAHLWIAVDTRLNLHYGGSWWEEYQRVVGRSYPRSALAALCAMTVSPRESSEVTPTGLGLLGVGHIIHRLWPFLNPDKIYQKEQSHEGYTRWLAMSATVNCFKIHDMEIRGLRTALENKESELEELRREHSQLQSNYRKLE